MATLVVPLVVVVPATPAAAHHSNNHQSSKVTICHRTKAVNNPYRKITVKANAVNGTTGHGGHTATATDRVYPNKVWGDIIPGTAYAGLSANAAIFAGTTTTPKGRPACGAQTAAQFYANTVNQVDYDGKVITPEDVIAELNAMGANEDAALLQALGGSFSVDEVGQLDMFNAKTGNPSGINGTSAVLNGTVSIGGDAASRTTAESASVVFEHGTSPPALTSPPLTASPATVSGTTNGTVATTPVTVTLPTTRGTTYYYRVRATTDAGAETENILYGGIVSFRAPLAGEQVVVLEAGEDAQVGDAPRTLTLSAAQPSQQAVTLSSLTTTTCTTAGAVVTVRSAGTCTLKATAVANGSYAEASATDSFTIAKTAQRIELPPVPSWNPEDALVLSPSTTSGQQVSLRRTAGSCSLNEPTLTGQRASYEVLPGSTPTTCTVEATVAEGPDHLAAATVSRTWSYDASVTSRGDDTVWAPEQVISFAQPTEVPVSLGTRPVTAAATSSLAVAWSSSTPTTCTVPATAASGAPVTVTLKAVGTCTLRAAQAGDADWRAATPVSRSFEVTRKSQAIAFEQPANTYVGASASASATATSGLPVEWAAASTDPLVCSVGGSGQPRAVTLHNPGTCTLTTIQGGDATWAPAAPVTRSFDVAPDITTVKTAAEQDLTFGEPAASVALSAGKVEVTASSDSGLPVRWSTSTPAVCSAPAEGASPAEVLLLDRGTCTVTAHQDGSADYLAATPESHSFSVTSQTAQVVTFTPQPSQVLGTSQVLTATAETGPVTFDTAAPCSVDEVQDGSTTTHVLVAETTGTCSVRAVAPPSPERLSGTSAAVLVTITAGDPGLQLFAPLTRVAKDGPFDATVTVAHSGGVLALVSATDDDCSVASSPSSTGNGTATWSVTPGSAGTCVLTATVDAAGDRGPSEVARTVPLTRATPVLTVSLGSTRPATSATWTATTTSPSDGAVTLTTETPAVCTVSGTQVAPVSAGTCRVSGAQAQTGLWNATTGVGEVVLSLAPQSVAFDQPPARTFWSGRVLELGPLLSATSGGAVSLTSSTASCTAAGTTVTLVSPGTCTVRADQPGDAKWAAADGVSRSFTSHVPEPVVTTTPTPTPSPSASPSASPSPTLTPTATPSPVLTSTPLVPSPTPSLRPTSPVSSTAPSARPTAGTASPTSSASPSTTPSRAPSPTPAPAVVRDVPRAGLVPVPAVLPQEGGGQVRATVNTARSMTGAVAPPSTTLGTGVLRKGQAATLPGRFLFEFDSAVLTPRGRTLVKALVQNLRGNQAVTCEGYTDYAGSLAHEMDLSSRRSVAVCKALVAYGAKVKTAAKGYGPARPVQIGGKARDRHENRRVVVVVTK